MQPTPDLFQGNPLGPPSPLDVYSGGAMSNKNSRRARDARAAGAGPAEPFRIMAETGVGLWTGYVAEDLPSLLHGLRQVPPSSIYYHVHHAIFQRTKYTIAEYTNDFARWVDTVLHQKGLAEKLSAIDPMQCRTVTNCGNELVRRVGEYVAEEELFPRVPRGHEFHFLEARTFVFETGVEARDLDELLEAIPVSTAGSIIYHFVEARFRNEDGADDFSRWLRALGEEERARRLERVNPHFYDAGKLRYQILDSLRQPT